MTALAQVQRSDLEIIAGNYKDAFHQAVPGTVLHVDELMNRRRTEQNPELQRQLQHKGFYTPDGELYFLKGKTPYHAITREPENLVLHHIDDAFEQLVQGDGNYRPPAREVQRVLRAKNTLVTNLTKLHLVEDNSNYCHFDVPTEGYDTLNREQRRLAERVYGQGKDFIANMEMLKKAGINAARVFVPNPAYVQKNAAKGAIGLASWLNSFYNYSIFNANNRDVLNHYRVFGVRASEASQSSVEEVPQGAVALKSTLAAPTVEDVIRYAIPRFVPEDCRENFAAGLQKLYKR